MPRQTIIVTQQPSLPPRTLVQGIAHGIIIKVPLGPHALCFIDFFWIQFFLQAGALGSANVIVVAGVVCVPFSRVVDVQMPLESGVEFDGWSILLLLGSFFRR